MPPGISASLIVLLFMEEVWSRRGHVGPESGSVTYARALAMLQSCPYVKVSLHHAVLRKKTYKVCLRCLASDVQLDILVQLGHLQRSFSASEFYEVELSSAWSNWIQKSYTLCVLGVQHASKCQQLFWIHVVLNGWACTHTSGYIHAGCSMNDQNRSHAISHVVWAYHLYLAAVGALPAAQGVIHKSFLLLVLLHFSLKLK